MITNPNQAAPLRVYTPNISDRAISFPDFMPLKLIATPLKDSFSFKKLLTREIMAGKLVGPSLFQNDPDIPLLICFNNKDFLERFEIAFQAYENGEWDMARQHFEKLDSMFPAD